MDTQVLNAFARSRTWDHTPGDGPCLADSGASERRVAGARRRCCWAVAPGLRGVGGGE